MQKFKLVKNKVFIKKINSCLINYNLCAFKCYKVSTQTVFIILLNKSGKTLLESHKEVFQIL